MIRERGGAWQVDLRIGGLRFRESYPTQAEAIKRESDLKIATITGIAPSAPDKTDVSLTLARLRQHVIERVWKGQKTEALSAYLSDKVVKAIGPNVVVANVDAKMIDAFIATMEARRNSNGTINRKLAVLSKMLHFAKTREYITTVPHIEFKPAPKSRDRYLSADEEVKLLALCKLWSLGEMHDLIVFLVDTGARVGEAIKLEPRDLGETRVTFRDTKNGTTRSVPMTTRVREMMERREATFDMDYPTARITWDRLRSHLGLAKDKQFVIHMLRHTCASRLVQRGARIQFVKEWLGHKNINQTMKYSHLAPESLDSMVALLEQPAAEKPRHLGVVKGEQA